MHVRWFNAKRRSAFDPGLADDIESVLRVQSHGNTLLDTGFCLSANELIMRNSAAVFAAFCAAETRCKRNPLIVLKGWRRGKQAMNSR